MTFDRGDGVVAVGSSVRIRTLGLSEATEVTVSIVPPGDGGLYRLSPNTILGRALLGHRRGDIVPATTEAYTVEYEIVAVAGVASMANLG